MYKKTRITKVFSGFLAAMLLSAIFPFANITAAALTPGAFSVAVMDAAGSSANEVTGYVTKSMVRADGETGVECVLPHGSDFTDIHVKITVATGTSLTVGGIPATGPVAGAVGEDEYYVTLSSQNDTYVDVVLETGGTIYNTFIMTRSFPSDPDEASLNFFAVRTQAGKLIVADIRENLVVIPMFQSELDADESYWVGMNVNGVCAKGSGYMDSKATRLDQVEIFSQSGNQKHYDVQAVLATPSSSILYNGYFFVGGKIYSAVAKSAYSLTFILPNGTDLTNLTPAFSFLGADMVSENGKGLGESEDFTRPVQYTIKTPGGDPSEDYVYTVRVETIDYSASVNPASNTFSAATQGYSPVNAQEFTITNRGTSSLYNVAATLGANSNFAISTDLSGTSIPLSASVTISVKPKDNLPAGDYTDTLTIAADNFAPLAVPLSFTVNAATYTATVTPASKTFATASANYSDITAQQFTISNTGTGTLKNLTAELGTNSNFEISTGLSATNIAPDGTATVSVRPKNGLTAGEYTDTLTISGDNGLSRTIPLSFSVYPPGYNSTLNPPAGHQFPNVEAGYAPVTAVEYTLTNTGTGTLTNIAATLHPGYGDYFEISVPMSSSTIAPGASATFSVKPKDGLPAVQGMTVYDGLIEVTGDNGVYYGLALGQVVTGSLTVSPVPKRFNMTQGYSPVTSQEFTITNASTRDLTGVSAALGMGTNSVFEITQAIGTAITGNGGTTTFRIKPIDGLLAGNHGDYLLISDGTTALFKIPFSCYVGAAQPSPSGGGGGGIAAPATTVKIGGLDIPYTIDKNGVVTINPTEEQMKKIIEAAKDGTIAIDLSGIEGATGMKFEVAAKWFDKAGKSLLFKFGFGKILINDKMMGLIALREGIVTFIVKKGSIEFDIQQDGKSIGWYSYENPITVSMPGSAGGVMIDKATGAVVPRSWYSGGEVHAKVYATGTYDVKTVSKQSFTDTAGLWMDEATGYMAARGVVAGVGDNLFAPNTNVTRGQFITMLMRAVSIEPQGAWMVQQFDDAKEGAFYYDALLKAKALGLVSGIGDNTFAPDAEITRQDMFVMLYRAMEKLGMMPDAYTDQFVEYADWDSVASYATDILQNMSKLGLVSGKGGGALDPTGTATRAEAAQVLYNVLERDAK